MKVAQPGIYLLQILKFPTWYYVGQSSNIQKRYATHISYLKKNYHVNKYLQNFYNQNNSLLLIPYEYPIESKEERELREQEVISYLSGLGFELMNYQEAKQYVPYEYLGYPGVIH